MRRQARRRSFPIRSSKNGDTMRVKDKIETYLLLRLEHFILELRQQQWVGRQTSSRILKWVDERLSRRRELAP